MELLNLHNDIWGHILLFLSSRDKCQMRETSNRFLQITNKFSKKSWGTWFLDWHFVSALPLISKKWLLNHTNFFEGDEDDDNVSDILMPYHEGDIEWMCEKFKFSKDHANTLLCNAIMAGDLQSIQLLNSRVSKKQHSISEYFAGTITNTTNNRLAVLEWISLNDPHWIKYDNIPFIIGVCACYDDNLAWIEHCDNATVINACISTFMRISARCSTRIFKWLYEHGTQHLASVSNWETIVSNSNLEVFTWLLNKDKISISDIIFTIQSRTEAFEPVRKFRMSSEKWGIKETQNAIVNTNKKLWVYEKICESLFSVHRSADEEWLITNFDIFEFSTRTMFLFGQYRDIDYAWLYECSKFHRPDNPITTDEMCGLGFDFICWAINNGKLNLCDINFDILKTRLTYRRMSILFKENVPLGVSMLRKQCPILELYWWLYDHEEECNKITFAKTHKKGLRETFCIEFAHYGDILVLDWAVRLASPEETPDDPDPSTWSMDDNRFNYGSLCFTEETSSWDEDSHEG